MPHPQDTAYPRLKSTVTDAELAEIYTPTPEEIDFATAHTQSETTKVGVLLLLKTFQRLGYFISITEIPRRIVRHITRSSGLTVVPDGLATYDISHTRVRHLTLIRARLQVTAYSRAVRPFLFATGQEAAQTKEDLADIINVMLETLIRHRYELPAFSTLDGSRSPHAPSSIAAISIALPCVSMRHNVPDSICCSLALPTPGAAHGIRSNNPPRIPR